MPWLPSSGSVGHSKHRKAFGHRGQGGDSRVCAAWLNREAAELRRIRAARVRMYASVAECFAAERRLSVGARRA